MVEYNVLGYLAVMLWSLVLQLIMDVGEGRESYCLSPFRHYYSFFCEILFSPPFVKVTQINKILHYYVKCLIMSLGEKICVKA